MSRNNLVLTISSPDVDVRISLIVGECDLARIAFVTQAVILMLLYWGVLSGFLVYFTTVGRNRFHSR